MQIQQLEIDRIGRHADLSADALTGGLNIIFGSPSSGKTTLANLIRSLIYGRQAAHLTVNELNGSALVQAASGRYRLARQWRAGAGGALTVAPQDGTSQEQSAEHILPKLPERLFERVFQTSFRGVYDSEATLAEAEAALTRTGGDPFAIGDAERRLSVLEARRAEWLRTDHGDSPLDNIARRREHLTAEIAEIEHQWGERNDANRRRRTELDQLAAIREGNLADTNRQTDAVEAEIQAIDAEHQKLLREYDELQRTTDPELSQELQSKLSRITEQMLRWNRVLNDVVERRDRIRNELVEWATGGGENGELGGPAARIAAMEQLIADVKGNIKAFKNSTQAASNCGCGHLHEQCNHTISELREHLYELCEELSRQQYKYRRNAMNTELKQLRRCHGEVTQYLQRLVKRRNQLLRRLGEADPTALARVVREQSELCEVEDNDALFDLVSIKSFEFATDWEAVQRRLGEIDYQLEELRSKRIELNRAAEQHRLQLSEIQVELNGLGAYLDIDESVAEKRAELQRLDERQAVLMVEWNALNDDHNEVLRQLEQLRSSRRTVNLLSEASHYLHELTSHDFVGIRRSPQTGKLIVESRSGQTYELSSVAQQTRDLAHLAICLAAVANLEREGIHCPLVLDDLFAHVDDERIATVAGVLRRFAEQERQIIATTGWEAAAARCESIGATVRRLAIGAAATPNAPTVELSTPAAVDVTPRPKRTIELDNTVAEPVAQPTFGDGVPDDTYYLERTDPIEETPDLEHDSAAAFRAHGVDTIGDFLQVTAEDLAAWSSVRMNSAQLRFCQGVAGLLCDVINLRPYDVRILVSAGIQDAHQLRRMSSEQLLSRVEAFVRTTEGRALLVSGDDFELARVANWIRSARESREFHRETERQQARRTAKRQSRGSQDENRLSVFGRRGRRDGNSSRESGTTARRGGRSRRGESSGATDSPNARSAASRTTGNKRSSSSQESSTAGELRFHLSRKSDVEAAPSIGPKMAEHLAKIGVISVGDLLDNSPETIAENLDHKRVNAELVQLWQRQAEWVCRVPELRGHDAQFLVACGYETVEELAGVDAQSLFDAVDGMVDTKEGRRILRGGKKPDLEEIADWLNWSKQSRELRAA